MNHPSYQYAIEAASKKSKAPRYVKKQCREFLKIAEGKSSAYKIAENKLRKIDALLKLLIMPKGLMAGRSVYECLGGYQWLLIVAAMCTVYRGNPRKRRYETVLLEIARKNGKTFLIAVLFILLLLLEPKFSKFFSVAPDGKLSREVQEAIKEILRSSPALGEERFKIYRDRILCKLTENQYNPLNYSNDKLDGKLPSVFLVDETGALPTPYAIEAMRSGQLTILNKLGCIISTKYPRPDNPFEGEVAYAKRVLDGAQEDDTLFALLYEPDNAKDWMTDDLVIAQANPLALEIPEIWNDLLKKRKRAITMESARENFLCKHCNILYQGAGTENFVAVEDVKKGRVEAIDWSGRDVWLGLDLAMTDDNCAVAIVAEDDDGEGVLCEVVGFIPEDRITEKSAAEKVDYQAMIRKGVCFACGDRIVNYGFIEEFILGIEERLGVSVLGFGFDRYNCMSTAQKLEEAGWQGTVVTQHSSVLHPPTKLLSEIVSKGLLHYTDNPLLEINFANAKCTFDTNMNRFVNKKKSSGKIDMVAALIDAVYLLQQARLNGTNWVVQI